MLIQFIGAIMHSIVNIIFVTASLALCAGQVAAQSTADAQGHVAGAPSAPKFDAQGIARTETVRSDFDGKREAIQVRVDFAQGASFPKHSHPGVEIAYVLSGVIEYEMNGKTFRLKAGESLYIPAGAVHSARNVSSGTTSELATYLVEKNQPVVILDK
jgi:quercetin dioxygenase-like cupin family protein